MPNLLEYVIFAGCIVIYYLNSLFAIRSISPLPEKKRFLVVIAHPDDECMFFGPSILGLSSNENEVHVLCMSSGNADGIGLVRRKELIASCTRLGVSAKNVTIIDHTALQDGMANTWEIKVIARELSLHLQKREQMDFIVTFDEYGVSSHPNHSALLPGIEQYIKSLAPAAPKPQLFKLLTTNLGRKYIGLLDALNTLVLSTVRLLRTKGSAKYKKESFLIFMNDPRQVMLTQYSMVMGHRSQMRWFRWAWVLSSRYMYFNELRRVKIQK